MVKTLPDTLADAGPTSPFGTLGDLETKAVVDTLTNAQAVVKAETFGNTLDDVEAQALVDMLTGNLL